MPSDRSTFIKILGFFAELWEQSKAIFNVLIVLFGASGLLLHFYAQYSNYIWFAFEVLCIISAIVITWAVTKQIEHTRDETIASAFFKLEEAYIPFEREATNLFYELALKKDNDSPLDLALLTICHEVYLRKLCDTATLVLSTKRPWKGRLTANIKQISVSKNRGKVRYTYKSMVRSETYDQQRIDYDDALEKEPLDISANYVYRRIFDEGYTDDFYVHNDIDGLLREIIASRERPREPNSDSPDFYKSFIALPVYGEIPRTEQADHSPAIELSHEENYLQYKGKNVFGLMCVDSATKRTFNAGYDLDVMRQITAYAF